MSGINLCILHPYSPLSLKKGGKLINWIFRKKSGRLYSHVYAKKNLKGIPVRINNPYLIWMKDLSFDQQLGRRIPLMSGMYTCLFPWKFSHIYSSYEPQKVPLHTKTLGMHVLWGISARSQAQVWTATLSPTGAVGYVVWSCVSGHRRWTVLLPPLWFQCLSDRAWERRRNFSDKTAEGRELGPKYWEWRHGDKELLGSISWCSEEGWGAYR